MMSEAPFHPLNPQQFRDPYPHFAEARKSCPIREFEPGFFFVANDQAVRVVLKTPIDFSSQGNFGLKESGDPPVVTQVDGEQHARLRAMLEQSLNAQVYRSVHAYIARSVHVLLDQMLEQHAGRADFMASLAAPLPAMVISHLIGVPEEQSILFRSWITEINAAIPNDYHPLEGWKRFKAFIHVLIDERRRTPWPPDDLITRLMQEHPDGTRLTDDEIRMAVFQLLMAGTGSTSELLGNLVYTLLRTPQLWERVKADRRLIIPAIEESLRHDSPIMLVLRTCPHASQLEGVRMKEGNRVFVGLASANRDEAVWSDPDDFSLDRPKVANHLAFGFGQHFCLGSELARSEARIVLEILFERLPQLRLAEDYHYEPEGGAIHRGPKQVLVCWS